MLDENDSHEALGILKTVSLFKNMPQDLLLSLSKALEPRYLSRGEILVGEHDLGSHFYIINQGLFRVISSRWHPIYDKFLYAGDLIGEMAFISHARRNATIFAARDSVVYQIEFDELKQVLMKQPDKIFELVRFALKREKNNKKPITAHGGKIISVIKAGHNVPRYLEQLKWLRSIFEKETTTKCIDADYIQQALAIEPDFSIKDVRVISQINHHLSQLCKDYDFVFIQPNPSLDGWTQYCLTQVDFVLFITASDENLNPNPLEHYASKIPVENRPPYHLVLFHPQGKSKPTNTRAWLKDRAIDSVHHIVANNTQHASRIIRRLSGRATSLVLSGGGAKGFAYVGLKKALEEANIKIDHIGGVSAGALTGSILALDISYEESKDIVSQKLFPYTKKLIDYTFPSAALAKGKVLTEMIKGIVGEATDTEDLLIPFFCMATNLNTHQVEILSKGLLWQNIRASMAIPGVFPPFVNKANQTLVDGGILNNFPVNIMRMITPEHHIIGANVSIFSDAATGGYESGWISGWRDLYEKKCRQQKKPNILYSLIESLTIKNQPLLNNINKYTDTYIPIDLSDIGTFDFKTVDQLIDKGYEISLKRLAEMGN